MTNQLWVPGTAKRAYFCRVCKQQFTASEHHLYLTHFNKCFEENGAGLLAESRQRAQFNEAIDPEWQTYNEALKARGLNPEVQYNKFSRVKRVSES